MISSYAAVGLVTLTLLYALLRRFTRPSLLMIRGPKSPSFIFGNLLELLARPVGEAEFAWQNEYGNIVRFKSVFGEDRLMITDPKALHKILATSTYDFPKLPNLRVASILINGRGIIWSDGEDHKRQRNVLLPGFGPKESRAFYPIFKDCAESVSAKWVEILGNNNGRSSIDVLDWLSRSALDAIGRAAFDVHFGTIQNDAHPLAEKYKNFFVDLFGLPTPGYIFVQAASRYIPKRVLRWLGDNSSSPRLTRMREVREMATKVAEQLIEEKADALLQGKGNRDIFSLLVKANMDADAKLRMSDDEMISQMRTLLIAGHETTATTMTWTLLELAKNPEVQSKLRDEIKKTIASAHARGDSQLDVQDLDAMPYLNAVIKEGLRFHPAAPLSFRMALKDELLPLSKPLLTDSGDMINEVLIPGGTEFAISIAAYNRNQDIWGEDANEFKPERWLVDAASDRKLPSLGVYSHLMTFFTGTRACLGWRFALLEIQAILSTLIPKFEFAMTYKATRIVRQPMIVMAPMVEGEFENGAQLPLSVSLVPQDDDY